MNTLALLVVAVNPAVVAVSIPRSALFGARASAAFIAALATVVVLAGCSGPLLDWLDVSPPTFRVAAGVVLGLASARWVLLGAKPRTTGEKVPIFSVLLSPQLVAVAITAGTEVGGLRTSLSALVALVASGAAVLWQDRASAAVWSWASRLVGVAGIAFAVALIVDGVKTV